MVLPPQEPNLKRRKEITMDFSKFDSWVKVPPRTYKFYQDRTGEWDALAQSYHSHVKDIYVHKNEKEDPCVVSRIGIVFAELIGPLDVWRVSYAATPPEGILSNEYIEDEETVDDEDSCANLIADDQRILGYFTDQEEAFKACDKAAVEIAGEVNNALRNNRPSLYFSTYFLTNNYWPFGGERPEGDTGGTYTFEYAPEEEKKEESNKAEDPMEEEPKTFMDILCEMESPSSLDYDELKAALIRGVCEEIDIEACGITSENSNPYKYCGFFVEEEQFDMALDAAYESFLKANCEDADNCYLILRGLQTESLQKENIHLCAENAIIEWVGIDDIQIDVLRYVYSELGKKLP